MEKKVSIIIPVYNSEKYVSQCLESILNQSYHNLEIICVNDGSTDNSLDILYNFKKQDSRIYVYSKKNEGKGAASARNYGLCRANGDYIMFLDSDDFFETDMIEKMLEKAVMTDADIVICGAKDYDDRLKKVVGYNKKIELELAPSMDCFSVKDCSAYIFQIAELIAWNKMFRVQLIRENDLYFEAIPISDDQYLPAIALVLAKKIAIVDEKFINYRINTGTSQVDSQARYPQAAYQATFSIVKKFRELGLYEEIKRSYINITLRLNRLYFDRMRSYDTMEFLYNKYREEVWPNLGAVNLPEDYFYDTRLADWYKMISTERLEDILFYTARAYGAEMTTAINRFQLPYEDIIAGSKVVLVGKGLVGRYWYSQLLLSDYAEVVAWVSVKDEITEGILYDQILYSK